MQDLVKHLTALLKAQNRRIVTAESCTGGQLSAALTAESGASAIFDRGFITYSNQAKTDMLNVPESTLNTYGAVSPQIAEAMAQGALINSPAQIAISITGIAGPDGGTDEKPVGLVYIGYACQEKSDHFKHIFQGTREQIQTATTTAALTHAIDILEQTT